VCGAFVFLVPKALQHEEGHGHILAAFAGAGGPVNPLQVHRGDVGVKLRGGEVGVSKEFLYMAN
jgi:hypothetical protein